MNSGIVNIALVAGLAATAGATAQGLDLSRAYASELLADASARESGLASAAQDFSPAVHGFTQYRFNWDRRDDSGLDGSDNKNTTGFQNARTKVIVTGKIANDDWGYLVRFKFGPDGTVALDYAYGTYNLGQGIELRFGQFMVPLQREDLMPDYTLLFADRSVADNTFTQTFSEGVQVSDQQDTYQLIAAVSDGLGTGSTDYTSGKEADFALTGRANWKWTGDWKEAKQFTSFQNSPLFGMAGVAGHFQKGGETVATTPVEKWEVIADAQVKGNGWNTFASLTYFGTKPDGMPEFDDFGLALQCGVFVAAQWELIVGWDEVFADHDRVTNGVFNEVRVGFNHYIVPESHAAKVTVDVEWFPNAQAFSIAPVNTLTGVLASSRSNQFNVQAQVQLLF